MGLPRDPTPQITDGRPTGPADDYQHQSQALQPYCPPASQQQAVPYSPPFQPSSFFATALQHSPHTFNPLPPPSNAYPPPSFQHPPPLSPPPFPSSAPSYQMPFPASYNTQGPGIFGRREQTPAPQSYHPSFGHGAPVPFLQPDLTHKQREVANKKARTKEANQKQSSRTGGNDARVKENGNMWRALELESSSRADALTSTLISLAFKVSVTGFISDERFASDGRHVTPKAKGGGKPRPIEAGIALLTPTVATDNFLARKAPPLSQHIPGYILINPFLPV